MMTHTFARRPTKKAKPPKLAFWFLLYSTDTNNHNSPSSPLLLTHSQKLRMDSPYYLIEELMRIHDTQGGQLEGTALQALFQIGNVRAQCLHFFIANCWVPLLQGQQPL